MYITSQEKMMTIEQYKVYNEILNAVETKKNKIYFLDAPGGTGDY